MYRSLDLIPIPQDTLQADQLIHSDIMHVNGSVHQKKRTRATVQRSRPTSILTPFRDLYFENGPLMTSLTALLIRVAYATTRKLLNEVSLCFEKRLTMYSF